MKQLWLIIAFVVSGVAGMYGQEGRRERTAFQTGQPWKPTTDTRADVAIVYGVGGNPSEERSGLTFEERVQSWRDKGYTTHFMTGIAWGEYQDYFTGAWDGRWHLDEGQVTREGDTIWHGHMVPYIVPSMNFIRYMKERHIKRVIDAGIDAIYLEEPELIMPPGAPGKLHTHHTPENWAETMDPHFEKWADQATPYIWKPVQCLYQYFYVES